MGDQRKDGSFESFVEKFTPNLLMGDIYHCIYNSPSLGVMETGWEEGLTVNGEAVQIKDYARYDNPYCHAEFGKNEIYIKSSSFETSLMEG